MIIDGYCTIGTERQTRLHPVNQFWSIKGHLQTRGGTLAELLGIR
jgi:hypothetical protein